MTLFCLPMDETMFARSFNCFSVTRIHHWVSLAYAMSIGYVGSLSFTEQSQAIHNDLFWQLRTNWRSLYCQTVLDASTKAHIEVLQHPVNTSKSLKFTNFLKVFRNLFQNWHLTKNYQKWLKKKLSAHKCPGLFCSSRRR